MDMVRLERHCAKVPFESLQWWWFAPAMRAGARAGREFTLVHAPAAISRAMEVRFGKAFCALSLSIPRVVRTHFPCASPESPQTDKLSPQPHSPLTFWFLSGKSSFRALIDEVPRSVRRAGPGLRPSRNTAPLSAVLEHGIPRLRAVTA